MARLIRKTKKAGLPPGTLVYTGDKKEEKARINLIDYDPENLRETEDISLEDCIPCRDSKTTSWIRVIGLHDIDLISKIGAAFNLHPLLLEDIVNTGQRTKIEDFEDYIFIVIKLINSSEDGELTINQVSLILAKNFIITFEETKSQILGVIIGRIQKAKGRIRKSGTDYLTYAILDAVVDSYFNLLELYGDGIEEVEEKLATDPTPEKLQAIRNLKTEMILIRKSVWPVREVISILQQTGEPLIGDGIHIYLRDVYDHTIQVADTIESLRDIISGLLDIYLSSLSNRMNEVMKVLTIFASIFIPLTFLAGVYGMNFEYMPELGWHWSYFVVLGIMLTVIIGMLSYFKRKRWL